MCETINVMLKSEFRQETELKIFYTAMLVTRRCETLTENDENARKFKHQKLTY
jgi:hypothetical protein